jgi:hypothetical protein
MPAVKSSPPLSFDLRVTLYYVRPEVWRLLRVPHDIRMDRLHGVLQMAFDWTNSHLHQFHLMDEKGSITGYIGMCEPDSLGIFPARQPPAQDETKRLLKNFLSKPGDRIGYEYDFGDSWLHEITLAAVGSQPRRLTHASCLDGARACPPEDCGGPPGYDHLRAILKKPRHPEYAETIEWLGGGFDPAGFDLAGTNRALEHVRV